MDEVLRKIEELSENLTPPSAPESNTEQDQEQGAVQLPPEAFEELEKQSTESTNLLATQQGILEAILAETQSLHQTVRDAMR